MVGVAQLAKTSPQLYHLIMNVSVVRFVCQIGTDTISRILAVKHVVVHASIKTVSINARYSAIQGHVHLALLWSPNIVVAVIYLKSRNVVLNHCSSVMESATKRSIVVFINVRPNVITAAANLVIKSSIKVLLLEYLGTSLSIHFCNSKIFFIFIVDTHI
jgi:hypothetical protein